jgi:hypothetical protein
MELRNHPLMSYRGVPSWPPVWSWLGDRINRHPKGEVGILKEVTVPVANPFNRCFLIVEYKKATYMGCLLIDDLPFCGQVSRLLRLHCGESLASIGSLDLDYSL